MIKFNPSKTLEGIYDQIPKTAFLVTYDPWNTRGEMVHHHRISEYKFVYGQTLHDGKTGEYKLLDILISSVENPIHGPSPMYIEKSGEAKNFFRTKQEAIKRINQKHKEIEENKIEKAKQERIEKAQSQVTEQQLIDLGLLPANKNN